MDKNRKKRIWRVKYEEFSEVYALTGETVDTVAAHIEKFLRELKTERTNVLRVRLSMEEALLRWRDHFGEEAQVRFTVGMLFHRPTITLELAGERFDPMAGADDGFGAWSSTLLSSIGLSPVYA